MIREGEKFFFLRKQGNKLVVGEAVPCCWPSGQVTLSEHFCYEDSLCDSEEEGVLKFALEMPGEDLYIVREGHYPAIWSYPSVEDLQKSFKLLTSSLSTDKHHGH